MAGKTRVVEVEEIVNTGSLDPGAINLLVIYVHCIVLNANPEKCVDHRTVTNSTRV